MTPRGRFITLEGVDGAGKSTHTAWMVQALRDLGLTVLATREPGGTPVGESCASCCCPNPWPWKPRPCSCSRRAASTCAK